jgi:hypothetical protein
MYRILETLFLTGILLALVVGALLLGNLIVNGLTEAILQVLP